MESWVKHFIPCLASHHYPIFVDCAAGVSWEDSWEDRSPFGSKLKPPTGILRTCPKHGSSTKHGASKSNQSSFLLGEIMIFRRDHHHLL